MHKIAITHASSYIANTGDLRDFVVNKYLQLAYIVCFHKHFWCFSGGMLIPQIG